MFLSFTFIKISLRYLLHDDKQHEILNNVRMNYSVRVINLTLKVYLARFELKYW